MTNDLHLRRKLTLRAGGRQIVLVKRPVESIEHVLAKAFLWALYLPLYPDATVEPRWTDGRYRPDVLMLGRDGQPRFWAEAGRVGSEKLRKMLSRFPDTHLVISKWNVRLDMHESMLRDALEGVRRTAPVQLLSIPADAERFIAPDGTITITFDDVEVRSVEGE